MATKKYVSLDKLSVFLNKLKKIFATKSDLENKADSVHDHNDIYYNKSQIDSMELITIEDIDEICGGTIIASSEVKF